jgi:type IV secretory pathway protease TraF
MAAVRKIVAIAGVPVVAAGAALAVLGVRRRVAMNRRTMGSALARAAGGALKRSGVFLLSRGRRIERMRIPALDRLASSRCK